MTQDHPLSIENDERAARALDTLLHLTLFDPAYPSTLTSGTADLRHLADRGAFDWHEALAQAEVHYRAERGNEP